MYTDKTPILIMTVSRAIIKLGDIELAVFRLANGEYRLSEDGCEKAIDAADRSVRDFLNSKAPEALPFKGLAEGKIKVEGEKTRIKPVTLEFAAVFWGRQARNDNQKAIALLVACAIENLQRRADKAFGVVKSDEEYNEDFAKFMEKWQIERQRLRDVHSGMQQAAMRRHHPAAQVHDYMTKLICGDTAKEARMKELVDPNADPTIGLNYREEIEDMKKLTKAKVAYAYMKKEAPWQEQVERAVAKQ